MRPAAYRQYGEEASNWLKRGRAYLLTRLVETGLRNSSPELLEVGAGVGQNISYLAEFGPVDAIEVHEKGLERLQEMAALRDLYPVPIPFPLDRQYDVVCAMDVIEHIDDDHEAVLWMAEHVKPGGQLILTVPAYAWLYSGHDAALGHYRRYKIEQLTALLPRTMKIEVATYFNMMLFPAVAVTRAPDVLRRSLGRPRDAQRKQSSVVPQIVDSGFFRLLHLEANRIVAGGRLPFGLTCVCVARRR